MKNFLDKYNILHNGFKFPSHILLNDKLWQFLKLELPNYNNVFVYIEKKTGVVFKFDMNKTMSHETASVSIQNKNILLCEYDTPVNYNLRLSPDKKKLPNHFVDLVHNSFYYHFSESQRNDLIAYLNKHKSSYMKTKKFMLDWYGFTFKPLGPLYISSNGKYIKAEINHFYDKKLMYIDDFFDHNKKISEILSYYKIKNIDHHISLSEEIHYYTVNFYASNENVPKEVYSVSAVYNTLTNIATFTARTISNVYQLKKGLYIKSDPIIKIHETFIDNNEDIHFNLVKKLTSLYLKKYIKDDILEKFNKAGIDLSDGITEDNLLLLNMITI